MNKKSMLSTLWIVLVVNFIFCDVFTLFNPKELQQILTGQVGGMEINQQFLLIFSIIMEIPMLMILLSYLLKYKINRILNIAIAVFLIMVQTWSLIGGDNSLHYLFFSIVEITICIIIFIIAVKWKKE